MMVGILDKDGRLVAYREGTPEGNEVPLPSGCDLPADGSYKFDAERQAFLPLGTGFPKVASKPPISSERVIYDLAKRLEGLGDAMTEDVRDWCRWYEANLKQREDERVMARKIRGGAG